MPPAARVPNMHICPIVAGTVIVERGPCGEDWEQVDVDN